MEIGLLGIDQCTVYRRGEDAGEYFIPASELRHHSQSRIRPRHKLAINRLTLLLNGQESESNSYTSTADLPCHTCTLAEHRQDPREITDKQTTIHVGLDAT